MIEINEKQHHLAKGRENKRQAENQFHRLMVEIEANPGVEGSDATVASLLDEFLVNLKLRNRSKRTIYERSRYLQLFAEDFGRQRIGQCSAGRPDFAALVWTGLEPCRWVDSRSLLLSSSSSLVSGQSFGAVLLRRLASWRR
jgi:hypothetical protein